jgi:hypothetical protein
VLSRSRAPSACSVECSGRPATTTRELACCALLTVSFSLTLCPSGMRREAIHSALFHVMYAIMDCPVVAGCVGLPSEEVITLLRASTGTGKCSITSLASSRWAL